MSTRTNSLPVRLTTTTMTIVFVVSSFISLAAHGQMAGTGEPAATMKPTTSPATAAGVIPADPSTPRGAIKLLYSAMQDGDSSQIRDLLIAVTPTETKMVDAMAHRAEAEAKFRKAAVGAFGEQKAKMLVGDSEGAGSEAMSQIDSSSEKIDGDKATVDNNMGQPPLTLTKVGGKWKIPASEFSKGAEVAEIEKQLPDMEFFAGLINGYATDVAAGKYKTAEEAGDAIKGQIMIEMMKRQNAQKPTTGEAGTPDGATTEPTTRPGG